MFFRCKCGRNTNYGNLCVNCRTRHYGDLILEDDDDPEIEDDCPELEAIIKEIENDDE